MEPKLISCTNEIKSEPDKPCKHRHERLNKILQYICLLLHICYIHIINQYLHIINQYLQSPDLSKLDKNEKETKQPLFILQLTTPFLINHYFF